MTYQVEPIREYLATVLNSLPAGNLCKQLGPRSGPTSSGLIWIQTLFDTLKIGFEKVNLKKKADDLKACKITQHAKSYDVMISK